MRTHNHSDDRISVQINSIDKKQLACIRVNPDDTVLYLKVKIWMKVDGMSPPSVQQLLLGNTVVDEESALKSYPLSRNTIIVVNYMVKKAIIKSSTGSTTEVKLYPNEKVEDMKRLIQHKDDEHLELFRQQLFYYCTLEDRCLLLEDDQTVDSYNFGTDPVFQLCKLEANHECTTRITTYCMSLRVQYQISFSGCDVTMTMKSRSYVCIH